MWLKEQRWGCGFRGNHPAMRMDEKEEPTGQGLWGQRPSLGKCHWRGKRQKEEEKPVKGTEYN